MPRSFLRPSVRLQAIFLATAVSITPIAAARTFSGVLPAHAASPVIIKQIAYQYPSQVGQPRQIIIGKLAINTPVVSVGILPDGKLDVPVNAKHVGWYQLGPRPGETGNAVLDGHLTLNHGPGIFRQLNRLTVGDTFSVVDENGTTRTFRVTKTQVYDVAKAPLDSIFGKSDGKNLNIITCAGVWSKILGHYDKRLIVYSTLVDEGGAMVAAR